MPTRDDLKTFLDFVLAIREDLWAKRQNAWWWQWSDIDEELQKWERLDLLMRNVYERERSK